MVESLARSVCRRKRPLWKKFLASISVWGHSALKKAPESPGGKSGLPLTGVMGQNLAETACTVHALSNSCRVAPTRGCDEACGEMCLLESQGA